jgi:hypothetical protein
VIRRLHLLVWPGAVVALCAGCGSAVTPATGATATRDAPVIVEGQVVSNRGDTVTVAGVDGIDSRFVATPRTPVTRIVTAAGTDLAPGTCVVAGGASTGGPLTAVWVLLEGPAGCAHPGAALVRVPAGLSTLEGTVQNVAGQLVSIQGPDGAERFAISAATPPPPTWARGGARPPMAGRTARGCCWRATSPSSRRRREAASVGVAASGR